MRPRQTERQLTELFVLPDAQSRGLGRALLARAFPPGGSGSRCIIASPDMRDQALYLKAGVTPRYPLYCFWRKPEQVSVPRDLAPSPLQPTPCTLDLLGEIDMRLLEFCRDGEYAWLVGERKGFLSERSGVAVG